MGFKQKLLEKKNLISHVIQFPKKKKHVRLISEFCQAPNLQCELFRLSGMNSTG